MLKKKQKKNKLRNASKVLRDVRTRRSFVLAFLRLLLGEFRREKFVK